MKKELNIAIGGRVRRARRAMGLSRDELSEILGISTLFLGYIECGQKGMSLETLCNMCRALHVSADYLLLDQQTAGSGSSEAAALISRVPAEYDTLLKENLRLFLKMISSLQSEPKKADTAQDAGPGTVIEIAARGGTRKKIRLTQAEAESVRRELAKLDAAPAQKDPQKDSKKDQ